MHPRWLARDPERAARDAGGLWLELARVAAGRSEVTPAKRDRLGERAWRGDAKPKFACVLLLGGPCRLRNACFSSSA
jgi:hypothetical protein